MTSSSEPSPTAANDQPRPHHWVPTSWPAPIRLLARISRVLAVLEGVGIAVCLLSVIGPAAWQFVERNLTQPHVPFFAVPAWTDGVIRHSVFMLGFLGGAYATYAGRHIRIDAVTRALSPRGRMALRILTTAAALTIVSFFFFAARGFRAVTLEEAEEMGQTTELFTAARGALIIVVGYAVIAFHFLIQILLDIGWLASKQPPPAGWASDGGAH